MATPPGPNSGKSTSAPPPPAPKSGNSTSTPPPPGPNSAKSTVAPAPGPNSAKSTFAPRPGPYSGKSTLAMVARVSFFTFGIAYGSVKLKYLTMKEKSRKKAEAKGHH